MTDLTVSDTTKRPCLSRFWVFLATILSLAALMAIGYLYYQGRIIQNNLSAKIVDLNSSITIMQSSNAQKMQDLEQEVVVLTAKLDQLTANKTDILLFQINQLLSSANQSLLVYHDVVGAVHLLTTTQNLLQGNSQAMFINLKLALANDLTRLKQLSIVDSVALSGTLDALNTQVKSLQSVVFESVAVNKPSTDSASQSKWMKIFDDIKHKLYGLVRVSRASSTKELALDANAERMIRQSIRVDLLNAKMALLLHDNKAWQYSLANALSLTSSYFSGETAISLQQQLVELAQVNIDGSGANIDDTLKALNELNNM